MEQLMKTKEVASLMNVSLETATSFLVRHGLRAINLGQGRGLGRRWSREQVEALLRRLLEPEMVPPRKRSQRRSSNKEVLDLAYDDFVKLCRKNREKGNL